MNLEKILKIKNIHIIGSKSLTVREKKNKKGELDFWYNKHFLQFSAKSVEWRGNGLNGESQDHLLPWLKGKCHEIFSIRFFHESSSPKPLEALSYEYLRELKKIETALLGYSWHCLFNSTAINLSCVHGDADVLI